MNRTFQIPLLAATGLVGCGSPFEFEGSWNLDSLANGSDVFSFPLVGDGYTQELSMDIAPASATFLTTYVYTNGDAPYVYTAGPFDWVELEEGRFEIRPVDFVVDSFICEGSKDAPDALGCTADLEGTAVSYAFSR